MSLRKKSFVQRLVDVALWSGLPTLGLELIGVPRKGLAIALLILVPITAFLAFRDQPQAGKTPENASN
jgi:hypothetical protein